MKKAAPIKKATYKKATPAKKATPLQKAPPVKTAASWPRRSPAQRAGRVAGRAAGSDWTSAELAEIRTELVAELSEMRAAYERSLRDLSDLQQAGTDGAGDDQADAGSKTFEREQELSIAANRLDLLTQLQRAVERIGTRHLRVLRGAAGGRSRKPGSRRFPAPRSTSRKQARRTAPKLRDNDRVSAADPETESDPARGTRCPWPRAAGCGCSRSSQRLRWH